MNEKDRFLRAVSGGGCDRPPVIVPGSFVSMASREVMEKGGFLTPSLHSSGRMLSELSVFLHDEAGIENLGVPFTLRVESEAYGGETDQRPAGMAGRRAAGPSTPSYPLKEAAEYKKLKKLNPHKDGRLPVVLECIAELSNRRPYVPVVADVVGPLSLSSALIDAGVLLRALVNEPDDVRGLLSFLSGNTIAYCRALVDNGATAICIVDPFSTASTLGAKFMSEFSLPYIERITEAAHNMGCPVIAHLCGGLNGTRGMGASIARLSADCLSVDADMTVGDARALFNGRPVMAGLSSMLLSSGSPVEVRRAAERAVAQGVDVLSPSCGLDEFVTLANLRAQNLWWRRAM
ncbi:MAG: hypothetical protein HY890_03625 [Deltaproteobacteria bacterium]|nr:hypothetical protein [Deltaproteobacteria bacterium]